MYLMKTFSILAVVLCLFACSDKNQNTAVEVEKSTPEVQELQTLPSSEGQAVNAVEPAVKEVDNNSSSQVQVQGQDAAHSDVAPASQESAKPVDDVSSN